MNSNRKLSISVSLDPQQIERLDKICKMTKIHRSVLVREGVDNIIAQYEKQVGLAQTVAAKRKRLNE